MSKALLLVDIQNDYFSGGAFPLPAMEEAASKAAQVLAWARDAGIKVVHVRHEDEDVWGTFLVVGTKGAEINEKVLPLADETVITKNFPNSFRDTELAAELSEMEEVLIVGAMSNMCIDATARAAFDLGLSVTVIEDACAASDLEFNGQNIPAPTVHAAFMAALASAYGKVLRAEEVIRKID